MNVQRLILTLMRESFANYSCFARIVSMIRSWDSANNRIDYLGIRCYPASLHAQHGSSVID
jgi:hypothetical protein